MESDLTVPLRIDVNMQDFKAAFSMIDKNKDGRVNACELETMLELLGISVSRGQIQNVLRQASRTGDGLISEEEFLSFMTQQTQGSTSAGDDDIMEDLMAAFRVFDKDQNGYITKDEIRQAMEIIGESVTDAEIDAMMKQGDVDKDGRINYEEFARMLL